jgi:prepilin-type N-terminal cleavage/methylation domain-containing protein
MRRRPKPSFLEALTKDCAKLFIAHTVAAMHPRTAGHLCRTSAFFRGAHQLPKRRRAFTLIELLVVIAIIAILVGLLFPAFKAVQNQARQTQAKNDLTQIVNAVNAFYTDYGKYPISTTIDTTFGPGGSPATNQTLFTELRGCTAAAGSCPAVATINTRQVVFISPPDVKNSATPKSGVGTAAGNVGQYFDPWGSNYVIRIDGDYNNQVANPYTANAGATPNLQLGVIAWSLGTDGAGGSGDKNSGTAVDDVISWQ